MTCLSSNCAFRGPNTEHGFGLNTGTNPNEEEVWNWSVSMPSGETRSRQRSGKRQSYDREKVRSQEKDFTCECCRECESPADDHGASFFKGQLSHVGLRYDLASNGSPLRLV